MAKRGEKGGKARGVAVLVGAVFAWGGMLLPTAQAKKTTEQCSASKKATACGKKTGCVWMAKSCTKASAHHAKAVAVKLPATTSPRVETKGQAAKVPAAKAPAAPMSPEDARDAADEEF